jgi:hypothetical protein
MENFSSEEEMPRRQDKCLEETPKSIKEDIEDKSTSLSQK